MTGSKSKTLNNRFIFNLFNPVIFESLSVLSISLTQLVECMIFKRRMIFHLKWNFSSSPDPCSSDFEVGFFSVDTPDTEGILSECGVGSLKESFHCVIGFK